MKIIQNSIDISETLFMKHYKKGKPNHFAFLYRRNKLISIGFNRYKEDNKALYFGRKFKVNHFKKFKCIHAEIDCLAKVWGKYHIDNKYKLVVIRLNKHLDLQDSKPCKHCRQVLNSIGLSKIYYSERLTC